MESWAGVDVLAVSNLHYIPSRLVCHSRQPELQVEDQHQRADEGGQLERSTFQLYCPCYPTSPQARQRRGFAESVKSDL